MGYYKVITSLVGIILFLILYIVIIPPKVEIKEIEKEIIVEIAKDPTYTYNITSEEREMLARLVYREANVESLECQMAVVSVVINRWQDGRWGQTLGEVVYSPYQFTPADLLYKTTPTELNYIAVDLVLQNGCTLPSYVLYFRADYHFDWEGYKPYAQIDATCFGYFATDKSN
jgi:hypothetical protein